MAAIRRASMRANCASHSCWSGLSISAAAVGVGARCTVAGLFEIFNDDLIIAAPFVQADTGARQHMQAILERDAEQAPMLAKEGAAYLRLGVLEREVDMARGGAGKIGNLALDPDRRESPLQQRLGLAVQARDRVDIAKRRGGRGGLFHFLNITAFMENTKDRKKPGTARLLGDEECFTGNGRRGWRCPSPAAAPISPLARLSSPASWPCLTHQGAWLCRLPRWRPPWLPWIP